MFEPKKLNEMEDELCISNLSQVESSPEEVDKIISKLEFSENFAFFDQMEMLDN